MKKILSILLFLFIQISHAAPLEDTKSANPEIQQKPENLSPYIPPQPDIHEFKSVTLNENGEIVVEYDKKYYEELMRVYGGKGVLGFDPADTHKYNFTYKIEEKGESVFITTLKEKTRIFLEFYSQETNKDNPDAMQFDGMLYMIFAGNLFQIPNNDEESLQIFQHLYNKEYISLKKFLEAWHKRTHGEEVEPNISQNDYDSRIEGTKFFIPFSEANRGISTFDDSYKKQLSKYAKFISKEGPGRVLFAFDIEKDVTFIDEFIADTLYYSIFLNQLTKNSGSLYLDKNKDLFILQKENKNDATYENISISFLGEWINCWVDDTNERCELQTGETVPSDFFKKQLSIKDGLIYFNVSSFLRTLQQNGYFQGLEIKDIIYLNFWRDEFHFPYIEKKQNMLRITSEIASPKNVSTNPYLFSLNALLALLYLFTFYFTAQIFNSYFEELSWKKDWNVRISDFMARIIRYPFEKIASLFDWFFVKIRFSLGVKSMQKIEVLFKKYEHKFFILLCLILLGMIGQIIVDDFDILSLQGWLVIGIMIFVLAFVTLLKDLLLYLLHKTSQKENLKIEVISLGYLFSFVVALLGRFIGMIPWVMFGSVIKITPKSDIASRKIAKPILLFRILMGAFCIGIVAWLSTLFFLEDSFPYKFLIVTYFGLMNDTFFALLPFGMLWWVYILKDKALRRQWFVFTFIVFVFLLHTILNPRGDLNKILHFDGNLLILVAILCFWITITVWAHFYLNNASKHHAKI